MVLKDRLSREKNRFEMKEVLQLNLGHVPHIYCFLDKPVLIRRRIKIVFIMIRIIMFYD